LVGVLTPEYAGGGNESICLSTFVRGRDMPMVGEEGGNPLVVVAVDKKKKKSRNGGERVSGGEGRREAVDLGKRGGLIVLGKSRGSSFTRRREKRERKRDIIMRGRGRKIPLHNHPR